MDIRVTIIALFAVSQAATALQWSASPSQGVILHACAGQDVTFSWNYTTDPGETVTSVEWNFRGNSELLVAAFVRGSFLPTASFSGRVENVSSAGLLLRQVVLGDSGDYSVRVIGYNGTRDSFTESRMVTLQVASSLMTTDHNLHATQQSEVRFSQDTDEWHAVLSCGNFTYTDDPPIDLEWVTPSGSVEPSTTYKNGFFDYYLRNPVREGTYTCRVPSEDLTASCAVSNNTHEATVAVDGTRTRIVVMEAGNRAMKDIVRTLSQAVVSLENENVNLTQKLTALQRENDNLTRTVQNLSAGVHTPHVAFRAKLSGPQNLSSGDTLILPNVTLNAGNAYDPSTGVFTAPVSGVYYFSAMAAPSGSGESANFILESNSKEHFLFSSYAYEEGDHSQTGSGQTAVRLQRGERVWLVSYGDGSFQTSDPTMFSGFLLFTE